MARMKFMNTEIDNLTMQETLDAIDKIIAKEKGEYVVTPNVDHIVQLEKDKELKAVYDNASLILTDGKPLLWIAKWYGTPIKEKISGSDLFPLLCERSAQKGYEKKEEYKYYKNICRQNKKNIRKYIDFCTYSKFLIVVYMPLVYKIF